jgi:hypothetical protein
MRFFRIAVAVALLVLTFGARSFAQNISGASLIDIDPDTGDVTAICTTVVDGEAAPYYQAEVSCEVDANGSLIGVYTNHTGGPNTSHATASTAFTGVPGTTYTVTGTHSADLIYQYIDGEYIDYYNIQLAEGVGETYEGSNDWFLPGPPEDSDGGNIMIGDTTVSASYQNCFAQLKYRSVNIAGFAPGNHSFWWIRDSGGKQFIIDGGPQNAGCTINCGYLIDWITQGTVGHYPEDNIQAGTWFDSGTSSSVCPQVDNLEAAARNWPQTGATYFPTGPNSNTFAHDMANAGGFTPTQPPSAVGW